MNPALFETLLHESESATLDFKASQYRFESATNREKSELLKDILAFANSWRRATAFILIGVEESKEGRSSVIGISEHLDDAKLHQFVNQKTQRPVEFSYRGFTFEGASVGIVGIPIQDRPVFLVRDFGLLSANTVYVRDSSSTRIATPDEIARMGTESRQHREVDLGLEWGDSDAKELLSSNCRIETRILEPLALDKIRPNRMHRASFLSLENPTYYEELIEYVAAMERLVPLDLCLFNRGAHSARRIRFGGEVESREGIWISDHMMPEPRLGMLLHMPNEPVLVNPTERADTHVREVATGTEIWVEFGDVRPGEQIWTESPLWVGANQTTDIEIRGRLIGDDLATPVDCELTVRVDVECRPMTIEDINRYRESEE